VYNLGTNSGNSNKEIIAVAEQVTGQRVNLHVGRARPGDPAMLTADANKFIGTSGWKPQFNLEEIITHAWAWYKRV
jgi:UDP-glucose 4-epimerase